MGFDSLLSWWNFFGLFGFFVVNMGFDSLVSWGNFFGLFGFIAVFGCSPVGFIAHFESCLVLLFVDHHCCTFLKVVWCGIWV